MVTFPDVYGKSDPKEMVRKVFGEVPPDLAPLIQLELGVPMEVTRTRPLFEEVKERAAVR